MSGEQVPPRAFASPLGLKITGEQAPLVSASPLGRKIAGEQGGAIFRASWFGVNDTGEQGAYRVFASELGTAAEAGTNGRREGGGEASWDKLGGRDMTTLLRTTGRSERPLVA
jgi:hypothetical protein